MEDVEININTNEFLKHKTNSLVKNCFLCNKNERGNENICIKCKKIFCNKCLKSQNISLINNKNTPKIKLICPKCNIEIKIKNYIKELKNQKEINCKKCNSIQKVYIFKTMEDIFLFIKSISQYKPEYKEMELALSSFKIKGEVRIFCKKCLQEFLNEGINKFFNALDLIKYDYKNIDIEDDENDTLSSTIKLNETISNCNNIQSNKSNKELFNEEKKDINYLINNKLKEINEQIEVMNHCNMVQKLTFKNFEYYINLLNSQLKEQLFNNQQQMSFIFNKIQELSENNNNNNNIFEELNNCEKNNYNNDKDNNINNENYNKNDNINTIK